MARISFLCALLAFAFLASPVFAVERELTAHVTGPDRIEVSNCNNAGGPSTARATIIIENGVSQYMSVTYTTYDNASGTWLDAGKLCNVPANDMVTCTAAIPFRLGGLGEGEYSAVLIKLSGTSDAAPGDVFTANYSFPVRHFTGDRENNLLAQAARVRAALAAFTASCPAPSDCCAVQPMEKAATASTTLSEGADSLSHCDFTAAYAKLVSAETLATQATAAVSACASVLTPTPVIYTPAPLPTHATPSTTSAPETPTPEPAATPSPSPAGGTSSCPLAGGIVLLAAGLFAAFRK